MRGRKPIIPLGLDRLDSERARSMLGIVPELESRPDLLRAMVRAGECPLPGLRKAFMRRCARIISIPDIRDNSTALYALHLVHRAILESFRENWCERMGATFEGRRIYSQAVGTFKNVYINMSYEIRPRRGGPPLGRLDVARWPEDD